VTDDEVVGSERGQDLNRHQRPGTASTRFGSC